MSMKAILLVGAVVSFGLRNQAFSQGQDYKQHHPNAKVGMKSDIHADGMCEDGTTSCQMMGQECPMMQDGQAGMMHGLMHSDKVNLNVTEIDDGVIIKWTSSDKETAKKLKSMAQDMKKMQPMMKGHMDEGMRKEKKR
jgi:hypothetical protein